jgi:hypothetical protein
MKELMFDNLVKSVLTPTIESNVPLLRPVSSLMRFGSYRSFSGCTRFFGKTYLSFLFFTTRLLCDTRIARVYPEDKMKQNITLAIEKEIIRKGKLIAAQNDTSISKMLSDQLKEIIDKEEQYQAAKRKALHTLKKGVHLGGKITWRRENLYERERMTSR